MELDERMKALIKDLGMALHQALTKDTKVKSITEQIKVNGFDIYLVMEANIALDRREEGEGRLFLHGPEEEAELESISYNRFDENFLAGLQIKIDE